MAARGLRPVSVRVVHSGMVVSKTPSQVSNPSVCFFLAEWVGWFVGLKKTSTILSWCTHCKSITEGMLYSVKATADWQFKAYVLRLP